MFLSDFYSKIFNFKMDVKIRLKETCMTNFFQETDVFEKKT